VPGVVLGSGLGGLADALDDPVAVPYAEIPGFPPSTVPGHAGRFVLGTLEGVPVACMQGRFHLYEGHPPAVIKLPIRTFKALGVGALLLTNAAGSLRAEAPPGSLMLITDHLNFMWTNPLIGPNDDEWGERFVGLEDAMTRAPGTPPRIAGGWDPSRRRVLLAPWAASRPAEIVPTGRSAPTRSGCRRSG
jgi:inosine/guanosine/xanthosine phosphorylase family protein